MMTATDTADTLQYRYRNRAKQKVDQDNMFNSSKFICPLLRIFATNGS